MTDLKPSPTDVRVLLLGPNWLGDAVMFSGLLDFLDRHRDLSQGRKLILDLAVRASWSPLFKEDPRLDNIFSVETNGRHGGLLGGLKLGEDFRKFNPAAVVLGPPSLRAGLAGWRSGAAIRIGYESDGRNFFLTHSRKTPIRGRYHHCLELVHLGVDLLAALGEEDASLKPEESLPSLPGCANILPAVENPSVPLWVLAPGATFGSAKSWPLHRAVDFVREALAKRKVRLVLLGDQDSSAYVDELARALNVPKEGHLAGPAGLVDLTGKTDLSQVVSILKASQVFVGNDSGLMHLSAALGVPTVGIFGSSNPDWTRPMGRATATVVVRGFSCHPCYLKCCNQAEFCLNTIEAEQVLQEIDGLLNGVN